MKRFVSFLILSLPLALLFAQEKTGTALTQQGMTPGNTYAVIVGISQYENKGIKSLDYAHRDAEVFADYLKSKSGGSVPEENIVLLQNEKATDAAIYEALQSLTETCKPNDRVYFYFSGHGDLESVTDAKDGYLLPYNSPRSNYLYNTISIETVNKIANTLSSTNNAKVVLITDACHSGKLAGSSKNGTFLVAEKLRKTRANEIRIASCDKNQLSNEDEGWGDGRGVFSYYFIKGLSREADKNADGFITASEMKGYLDSTFAKDNLLATKSNKQNPVITPVDDFKLAKVDPSSSFGLDMVSNETVSKDEDDAGLAPVPKPPQAYFFQSLEAINPEKIFDFSKLNKLSAAELPFAFISMLPDTIKAKIGTENISELESKLKADSFTLRRFKDKLVVLLSDRGQKIINLYLDGDEAELERRRYYNSSSSGYDMYPDMFAVALKLTKPDDDYRRKLEIKQHYFAGVAARLRIPLVEDPKPLIEEAMAEQLKAYELDENTAFVNNELGILYKIKKDYATAEKYLLRATQITDSWAIPWSNLISLYANMKEYPKGIVAYDSAISLQPNFQGTYVNGGVLYEKQNNFLYAEELYRKSIKLNSRHYLPFERLGYVYMNTTQYAAADSFFNEADIRKRGYHFNVVDSDGDGIVDAFDQSVSAKPCNFDTAAAANSGAMGYVAWGVQLYRTGRKSAAEEKFRTAIALDKTNPLAFHYIGDILYKRQNWKEAEIYFKLSVKYFLDPNQFKRYADSVVKKFASLAGKDCLVAYFRSGYYEKIEDNYYLATLYEKWNHFAEAEQQYRKIISITPGFIGGYKKLWAMLENIGRFTDAENVLYSFAARNKVEGDKELNAFYKRMIDKYVKEEVQDGGRIYYKAGVFLYDVAANSPNGYPDDRMITMPDSVNPAFVPPSLSELSPTDIVLPGIKEILQPAQPIEKPRTEGIGYLLKADSLLFQDINALADINYKIADMYVWLGLPENASPYYKKSVNLQPENAGTRLKLVDTYAATYYFKGALEQLDSLNNRKEINFDKQLLLAKYCIHFGRYTDAEPLLKEAKRIHPYKVPEADDLLGRMNLLAGNPALALPYYQQYLAANSNDHLTMYTIACLNAKMGNQVEAFKWLEMAMTKGFRYGWVLKFDNTWNDYRKLAKWIELQQKFPAKKYKG